MQFLAHPDLYYDAFRQTITPCANNRVWLRQIKNMITTPPSFITNLKNRLAVSTDFSTYSGMSRTERQTKLKSRLPTKAQRCFDLVSPLACHRWLERYWNLSLVQIVPFAQTFDGQTFSSLFKPAKIQIIPLSVLTWLFPPSHIPYTGNFGVGKSWRIKRHSPMFYPPIKK